MPVSLTKANMRYLLYMYKPGGSVSARRDAAAAVDPGVIPLPSDSVPGPGLDDWTAPLPPEDVS
jgi:hypothetical protein